uniref:Uncharacterized protein n=1 Tax=Pseudictyota dubia TaxID=2749911 RepID=A0A7R9WIW1_9STRA
MQCEVVTNKAGYDQNMIGEEIAINSAQRKPFREAFDSASLSASSATSSAVNTPYIWRIGTTKCQDNECVHIPAPMCGEEGTRSSAMDIVAAGALSVVFIAAAALAL